MGVVMTPLLGSCAFDELYEIAGGGDGMSFSVEVTQLQEEHGSSFRAPRITDTEISGDNMKMYVRRTTEGYVHRHEAKGVATRGISVSSIDKFILNSYTYSSSLSSSTPVSSNEEITKSDGWKSSNQWQKASDNMAFYAYNAGNTPATFSLSNGNPTLSYTVVDAVANQQDLLVAKNVGVTGDDTNTPISLSFNHALTAVQFGIGSTMADGTIKKIELRGIKNSGTYNYSNDTWTLNSSTKNYSITLDVPISRNKPNSGTTLITGQSGSNDLMLLMPQTLGDDAKLVVTIESNGISHDLTMSLLGGEWIPGHTVTYSLSTEKETGDYVLKVSDPSLSTNEERGSVSTTVTSYYQDYYGTQTPAAWTATYTYASGTDIRTPLDKAIISKTESGNGGTSGDNLTATIAKQYPKSDKTWTASEQGTENEPFDLSKYDPSSSTHELSTPQSANCYVVNAPGWYKIPLCYGNSLNNNSGYGTKTFQTHDGTQITNTNYNFASSVQSGKLLWQDEYALITPSSISKTSDGYLKFYVSPDAIAQGNAVIAALDGSNQILWSWHIWVTNMNLIERVNIKSGSNRQTDYHFMTKPVGYCEASTLSYPERVINIKITQQNASGISGAIVNTDKTTSLAITQSSTKTISVAQNCTFYQWGRKDPFPGAQSDDNTTSVQKLCYDADGNQFEYTKKGGNTTSGDGKQTMAGSILNPTTFYYSHTTTSWDSQDNDWCSTTYNDNWSMINTSINGNWADDNITKTVYDPCPIGFKMPGCNAFTRFTKDGNYHYSNDGHSTCNGDAWINQICVFNKNSYETNKGWSFYTQADDTGVTDFWYAFGFIDCWIDRYSSTGRGCLAVAGFNGNFWSARAYSAGRGCDLYFDSGCVNPRHTTLRAYGFAARPVSE